MHSKCAPDFNIPTATERTVEGDVDHVPSRWSYHTEVHLLDRFLLLLFLVTYVVASGRLKIDGASDGGRTVSLVVVMLTCLCTC